MGCLGREEGAPSGWPSSSEPVPGRHGASWAGVTLRTCGQGKAAGFGGKTPRNGAFLPQDGKITIKRRQGKERRGDTPHTSTELSPCGKPKMIC